MIIRRSAPIAVQLLNRTVKPPAHLQRVWVADVDHVNLAVMSETVAVPVVFDALQMAAVRDRR